VGGAHHEGGNNGGGFNVSSEAPANSGDRRWVLRLQRVEGSEMGESMDDERLGRVELTMGGRRRRWRPRNR
jgi:hypothetical protein